MHINYLPKNKNEWLLKGFLFIGVTTCVLVIMDWYFFSIPHPKKSLSGSFIPAVLNSEGTQALIKNKHEEYIRTLMASSFNSALFLSASTTATAIISPRVRDVNTVDIKLTANTHLLNAGEVELLFDPVKLIVTNLLITDSLCQEQFVITKQIDNEHGRLFYQCGTLSPFAGASTTLAVVTVLPQSTGTSTLRFGPQTHVLAHDGYGTNILHTALNALYSNPFVTNTDIYDVTQNE